jgi:hypothetical protein
MVTCAAHTLPRSQHQLEAERKRAADEAAEAKRAAEVERRREVRDRAHCATRCASCLIHVYWFDYDLITPMHNVSSKPRRSAHKQTLMRNDDSRRRERRPREIASELQVRVGVL